MDNINTSKFLAYQIPPYSLEAEEAVLGGILLNLKLINKVAHKLKPEAFYFSTHQTIYQSVYYLYVQDFQLDTKNLLNIIKYNSFNQFDTIIEKIIYLMNRVFSNLHFEEYVLIIINKYIQRSIIRESQYIIQLCYDNSCIDVILKKLAQMQESFKQYYNTQDVIIPLYSLKEVYKNIYYKTKTWVFTGIPSGFINFDRITQGLHKTDLIIIAGRPSMGKTAFCINIAYNIVKNSFVVPVIFSLEMSIPQLMYRLISLDSGIKGDKLKDGSMDEQDFIQLKDSIKRLSTYKLYIDDTANLTPLLLRTKIKKLAEKEKKLGLIIIDYLQLMQYHDIYENRVQELSQITRSLKVLAKEIKMPIVVLSQLSRSVENRQNKRPLLSDLRESGCLTGDAFVDCYNDLRQFYKFTIRRERLVKTVDINNFSYDYKQQIIFMYSGYKYIYKIGSNKNPSLTLTANHKLLTFKGWKRLDELTKLEDIISLKKQILDKTSIKYLKLLPITYYGKYATYDLSISIINNFIANNYLVHNSIEQDADMVCMLYREDYYKFRSDLEPSSTTEIIIAKHRNGPTGTFKLLFDPMCGKFFDLEII
uniref:replication helicase subunit n=1 Tax=Glaucosphaera vacuolata TaxID=38265 RepID=UPI001FCDB77D|nr:replication helicase subunit [Glaucosphaera vacuolata]UNJ18755.1 replication helicase subunit [Glaucosphaera vacuolata]